MLRARAHTKTAWCSQDGVVESSRGKAESLDFPLWIAGMVGMDNNKALAQVCATS